MKTNNIALMRLLQLASPALPVGAYAYSQGLEYAVDCGHIRSQEDAGRWVLGVIRHIHAYLEAPVFLRLFSAFADQNPQTAQYWNHWLFASRETYELQCEDQHLGRALSRLLVDLDIEEARLWQNHDKVCFATPYALASTRWGISANDAVHAYLWSLTENMINAAIKLIPLGQTAGQRLLSQAMPEIDDAVTIACPLDDEEIGCSAPGLALCSTLHETQYS